MRVTVTAEGNGQTVRFNSEMDTSDDIHSPFAGDVTPYNFDDRSDSLRADLDDLLQYGELDEELGVDCSGLRVASITKGATRGLPFIEV